MLRIPRITYEIRCVVKNGATLQLELLRSCFNTLGFDSTQITETKHLLSTYISIFQNSLPRARQVKQQIGVLQLKNVKVEIRSLVKEDWQTKWKDDFKAFSLGRRFTIIPSWDKKKKVSRKIPVYLGSGLAFGTGLHPTTRYMAQFMERQAGTFESFLDIGTGTGILTLLALHCGATDVLAVDISPEAVRTARNNFKINGFAGITAKKADIYTLKYERKYDYVAANLITYDLVQNKRRILALVKPRKYLAVSGISVNNYRNFRKAFDKLPLKCIKLEQGEGWNALLYKKQ